jgi:TRAP-type uncharacterized transport system substrate-binding protein
MAKLDLNRILPVALAAASACFVAGLAVVFWQQSRTQYLTLAAGDSRGESYILGSALKTVVERHYPRIRINLAETGGTVENLAMLDQKDWPKDSLRGTLHGSKGAAGSLPQHAPA